MDAPVRLCLKTGSITRAGLDPITPHTIRFRVFTALLAHLDRPIPHDQFIGEVYGNCRTPLSVTAVIQWAISDLRKWLAGSEWSIHTWHGWAYEMKRSTFEFRGIEHRPQDRPNDRPEQRIA